MTTLDHAVVIAVSTTELLASCISILILSLATGLQDPEHMIPTSNSGKIKLTTEHQA